MCSRAYLPSHWAGVYATSFALRLIAGGWFLFKRCFRSALLWLMGRVGFMLSVDLLGKTLERAAVAVGRGAGGGVEGWRGGVRRIRL